MERDACISHGASAFLRERLMKVSDAYNTAFCRKCGIFAINDPSRRRAYKPCRLCGDSDFGHCTIPYVYKLLIHYLAAIGINLRPEFATSDEYLEKVLKSGVLDQIPDVKRQLEETEEEIEQEVAAEEEEEIDEDAYDEYGDYGDYE